MRMYRLDNPVQKYAWGSRTFIPELLGERSPSKEPYAELWMGAHPRAPSHVIESGRSIPLSALIREDPAGMLGERVAGRFDGRLPFLLKVLAAVQPLSIQAHPDPALARNGFKREDAAGIPRDAASRNYRDPNHKPELICALTPFDAMSGFRPLPEIAGLLTYLDLTPFIPAAAWPTGPAEYSLRSFFEALINLSREEQVDLLDALIHRVSQASPRSDDEALAFSWVIKLSGHYPGDIGVIAPLLLNTVRLQPGEAFYTGAGVLHAYLAGAGVEIMANSDNVLRGGLTAKHVDPPELLKILTFTATPVRVLRGETTGGIEFIYQTPAVEFQLSRIILKGTGPYAPDRRTGPEIILCTGGSADAFRGTGQNLKLHSGDSIFIPFAAGDYLIRGEATFYRSTVAGGR